MHAGIAALRWAIRPIAVAMVCCMAMIGTTAEPMKPTGVAPILADNGEDFLKLLTNPTGDPGTGLVEEKDVFAGKSGVRVVNFQRFSPAIPGWNYKIKGSPAEGEYRYLRFAWKSKGCSGIMVQLHDEKDWRIRYTAGRDVHGWGTKYVSSTPPENWTVVTCDLAADYGECTIKGIALTAFEGEGGLFDHIYFGRSIDELNQIDATGYRDVEQKPLSETELETAWVALQSTDASEQYRAQWRLVAANDQAVTLLRKKMLATSDARPTQKLVQSWMDDLDHESYQRREAASAQLAKHISLVHGQLQKLAYTSKSVEVRWRVGWLLRLPTSGTPEDRRRDVAKQILQQVASPNGKKMLAELDEPLRW